MKILLLFLFISSFCFAQNNDNYSLAKKINTEGDSIFTTSEYKKALDKYNEAYNFILLTDSIALQSEIMNNIGICHDYLGEYDLALSIYNKAIKLDSKNNNKTGLATTYNNIGALYFFWDKYDLALENYLKGLALDIELGNKESEAGSYENIAIIYKNLRKFEKASIYYDKALTINLALNNRCNISRNYNNIGNLYNEMGQLNQAVHFHAMALKTQLEIDDIEGILYSYNNLGNAHFKLKEYNKASEYYLKALNLAKKKDFKVEILYSLKSLAELYDATKDYKLSNQYLKSYYTLKDEIFSEKKHAQIMDLEKKYKSEKKNQQIELLNKEKAKQDLELKSKRLQQNFWIGLSALGILLSIISIYFFINKKRLSDKLEVKNTIIEKALEDKNVLLKEIHHRVKNNLQIISSLLNMQSRFLDDDKSKEIVADSQNRIKSMSLIHQKLYQEDNIVGIETSTYFKELIDSLCESYGIDPNKVELKLSIESILLDVDTVIPLGLMLNELISNAFKYGVDKDKGQFHFSFRKKSTDELEIIIHDNGPGIDEKIDLLKLKSYGMKLVQSLSRKLKADFSFKNDNGLKIVLLIHKFKLSA